MAELLPLSVPAGNPQSVPSTGSVFPTTVAFWSYDIRVGWTWRSWNIASGGFYPEGTQLLVAGTVPSSYIAVVTRSDDALGFAAVPVPEVLSNFWKVDPPIPLANAPADVGKAIVGRWKPSITSKTGWAFDSWSNETWDIYPDGHEFKVEVTGTQVLYIVVARTKPDGTICPIPYNPHAGIFPPPAPPPGGGGDPQGGNPDGFDEVELLLIDIRNAIDALGTTTSGGADAECCTNVVSAIAAVAKGLTTIAIEMPKLAPAGSDRITNFVESIAHTLIKLTDEVGLFGTRGNAELTCICERLAGVVRELWNIHNDLAKPHESPDLKRIADVIDGTDPRVAKSVEDSRAKMKALTTFFVDEGLLDGKLAQILDG